MDQKQYSVFYLFCETLAAANGGCITKYEKAFSDNPNRTLEIFPSDDAEQSSTRGRI